MRVMLFGNDYNPLSLACLDALVSAGRFDVSVGICVPQGGGLLKTARKALRDFGPAFVLRRAVDLVGANLGAVVRRITRAQSGFASLREMARALELQTVDVTGLPRSETVEHIRAAAPEVIVVAGFSKIIKQSVIDIPARGCINVHPSLLPQYRGPNPLYWVLANGEPKTGVTVHFVDEGIDTGDIIAQREVGIEEGDDERTLLARCIPVAGDTMISVLDELATGPVQGTPQDHDQASYHPQPPRGASIL